MRLSCIHTQSAPKLTHNCNLRCANVQPHPTANSFPIRRSTYLKARIAMDAIHPFWVGTLLFVGNAGLIAAASRIVVTNYGVCRSSVEHVGLLLVAGCLTLGYASVYARPPTDLGFPLVPWLGIGLCFIGGLLAGIGAGIASLTRPTRRGTHTHSDPWQYHLKARQTLPADEGGECRSTLLPPTRWTTPPLTSPHPINLSSNERPRGSSGCDAYAPADRTQSDGSTRRAVRSPAPG